MINGRGIRVQVQQAISARILHLWLIYRNDRLVPYALASAGFTIDGPRHSR